MTGAVQTYSGSWVTLPALLQWNLHHTDGTAADSFSVSFWFSAGWEDTLKSAIRFKATDSEATRFYGIVDEYEVRMDGDGLLVQIYGRGMAGIMLDNQVSQREFYYARLSDMIKRYVTPYGIGAPEYRKNYWLTIYGVEYGESAWDAFCGFCIWGAGVQPRFLPEGSLDISGAHGTGKQITAGSPVLEAVRTGCRYGVYSAVVAKYIASGYEQTYENRDFKNRGGNAVHRMTIPRRNQCRAGRSTPGRILELSQREESRLKVTVSELFWAQPMDEIQVTLPKLGLQGSFLVTETENSRDTGGSRCTMTMYQL